MSKRKSVIKDWFSDSREDDFVHRGGLRSGWSDMFGTTSDYVLNGFVKPDTSEAEVREIHKLCSNRANILADGKNIVFTLNAKEETAKTDGRKVTVGTKVLDESSKSFSEKADIMLGLTTHEMAHIIHSSFAHLKKCQNNFHKSILNVLEDERIEYLLCEEFPGYASNIAKVKQYFFDEKYLVEEAAEGEKDEARKYAMELYDLFFKLVRYPKYLDADKMANYEIELDEMKAVLTPYPMTSPKVFNASEEILKIINKNIERKMLEKSGESGESKESSESDSSGESGKPMETSSKKKSSSDKGDKPTPTKEDIEDKIKSVEDHIADMMADLDSDNDGIKKVEVSESVSSVDFTSEFIHDKKNKATFRVGESWPHIYKEYLSEVKSDSKKLANSLHVRMYRESSMLRGLRSGALDECKLIEAVHGVKTVHLQKTDKLEKAVNIVMLIDESGSMSKGNRYKDAAKAAILIENAFSAFPIGELFIYGFTGDAPYGKTGTTDYNQIIRYREPGLNVKFGLGGVRPRQQNRDGHCIRAVANRVREFSNEPMIMFVISDGAPYSEDYCFNYADTRAAVLEVSKQRFFPIQIGIGGDLAESEQKKMFDDFINYSNPKAMVEDLRKLIIRKSHKIFGI